jgi:ferrous iron transport protein B
MKIDKHIVIIGQPKSGKSSVFNILADIKGGAWANQYDVQTSEIDVFGRVCKLIDMPGAYSLNSLEPVAKMTRDYLLKNEVDLIINVIDATLITRGLELAAELKEFGKPMLVALNMKDLADKHGVKIDIPKLSEQIGATVVSCVAVQGKGARELTMAIHDALNGKNQNDKTLEYTKHIEEHILNIQSKLRPEEYGLNGSARFYAIKALEAPDFLPKRMLDEIRDLKKIADEDLMEHHQKENFETVALERHHIAMRISEEVCIFSEKNKISFADRLDQALLHPFWGYICLFLFFAVYFASIFYVGSFLNSLMTTPLEMLDTAIEPLKNYNMFWWSTANGISQGLTGILGIVLPFFLPLVFLTSVFEETGYLSRIAFLVDGLFHKIGLHGKSVVPFIMGFGCAVPAVYATRMIENKRDRVVTAALLLFIPCSSTIAVIFALATAATNPLWASVVFLWAFLIIAVSGKVLSKLYAKPMGLALDIGALKAPSMKIAFNRSWFKIKDFIKEAFTFLIIGSVLLSWIEYFQISPYFNAVFKPFVSGVLGLPEQLSTVLFFGFFRKELIIVMMTQALGVTSFAHLPMTTPQIVIFIIFINLYCPCFTTFVVILKEFGAKVASLASGFSMIVAAFSAIFFKYLFQALGL